MRKKMSVRMSVKAGHTRTRATTLTGTYTPTLTHTHPKTFILSTLTHTHMRTTVDTSLHEHTKRNIYIQLRIGRERKHAQE